MTVGRAPALAALALSVSCAYAPSPERVVIGVAVAPAVMPAAELAAREVNAAGGVRGVPLELAPLDPRAYDDEPTRLERTLRHAERLVEDDAVVAVVGHEDSETALATAPLFNRHGLPQVVTLASHPAVTESGPWTFRLCPPDDRQGRALAHLVVSSWGGERVAVFHVADDYGRSLASIFRDEIERLGGRVVANVSHRDRLGPEDEELIRLTLDRLAQEASPPTTFALFQRTWAALWTVRQIRERGFDGPIVGGDEVGNGIILNTRARWLEGLMAAQLFDPASGTPRARALADAMRTATGRDAVHGHAYVYDAVRLVADALAAEGIGRENVRRHLERLSRDETPIDGVAGPFAFGADRNVRRPLYLGEVRGGRFHVVEQLLPPAGAVIEPPDG